MNGSIAYARVWRRILSEEEIKANMNDVSLDDESLLAYWRFTEGNGNVVRNALVTSQASVPMFKAQQCAHCRTSANAQRRLNN